MNAVTKEFIAARPTNIAELGASIIFVLQRVRKNNPDKKIWLVSGKVSPEVGSKNPNADRQKNEEFLRETREQLQQDSDKLGLNRIYFTSADIMPQIREQLLPKPPAQEFRDMWENIVKLGDIDGIYMTNNAYLSSGAIIEYKTGRRRGLHIECQTSQEQQKLATKVLIDYFAPTGKQSGVNIFDIIRR